MKVLIGNLQTSWCGLGAISHFRCTLHLMNTLGCCAAAYSNVYSFVLLQLETVHFRIAHALAVTSISGEETELLH